MRSLLHLLENNEAILLMYLADELPAEDRAEVEQMLAVDSGLRAELEQVRLEQEAAMGLMNRSEQPKLSPAAQAASVRNVSVLMQRWQTRRLAEPAVVARPTLRIQSHWWAYPTAAAALVVLALSLWWLVHSPNQPLSRPAEVAVDLEKSFTPAGAEDLTRDTRLSDVENQLIALSGVSGKMPSILPGEDWSQ